MTGEDFEVVHDPPCPGDVRYCTADANRLREVFEVLTGMDISGNLESYYCWMVPDPISIAKVLSQQCPEPAS